MQLKSWVVWPFLILKKFAVIFSVMGLLMALINEIVVKSNTFCCRKPEHNQFHSSDVCQALAYCGDVIEHNRYCWNNLQLSVINNISASASGKCMDGKSLQIWFYLITTQTVFSVFFFNNPPMKYSQNLPFAETLIKVKWVFVHKKIILTSSFDFTQWLNILVNLGLLRKQDQSDDAFNGPSEFCVRVPTLTFPRDTKVKLHFFNRQGYFSVSWSGTRAISL